MHHWSTFLSLSLSLRPVCVAAGSQPSIKTMKFFQLKRLVALAFLPPTDVVTGFDLVAGEFDDDADDLLDYFEKTWIGEPFALSTCQSHNFAFLGVGRKKPQFDHTLWNIYDRVVADLPRSNNSVEGWHSAFATRVAIAHPTVKRLADKIRREQSKFEIDIAQLLQGHPPKPKKALYRKIHARQYDSTQIHRSRNFFSLIFVS